MHGLYALFNLVCCTWLACHFKSHMPPTCDFYWSAAFILGQLMWNVLRGARGRPSLHWWVCGSLWTCGRPFLHWWVCGSLWTSCSHAAKSALVYFSPFCFCLCYAPEYCASRAIPTVADSPYLQTIGHCLNKEIGFLWTGMDISQKENTVQESCLLFKFGINNNNTKTLIWLCNCVMFLSLSLVAQKRPIVTCWQFFDSSFAGPQVISKAISVESIIALQEVIRRPPVIWDNLHANDYDRQRLFLGPYQVELFFFLVCFCCFVVVVVVVVVVFVVVVVEFLYASYKRNENLISLLFLSLLICFHFYTWLSFRCFFVVVSDSCCMMWVFIKIRVFVNVLPG